MYPCLDDINYTPRTFLEVFPTSDSFYENWHSAPYEVLTELSVSTINIIYNLLVSRYGNSHITGNNEDLWKKRISATIFQFAPTWEKKLEIQKKLRSLNDTELLTGSKVVYDKSYNPSTVIEGGPNNEFGEIDTVNEQTKSKNVRSKMEAYAMLTDLLDRDITEEFITRFKTLFRRVIAPTVYPEGQ